jgi:hypothetical protein
MKSKLPISFVLAIAALAVCTSAFAHHGSAAYSDKMVALKDATVTKFQWGNPHTIVMFEVKDDKGNVAHWSAEAGSPSALSLIGWSKTSMEPGDVITVYLFPAKSGYQVGRLNRIVLHDGTELRDSQQGGDKFKAEQP